MIGVTSCRVSRVQFTGLLILFLATALSPPRAHGQQNAWGGGDVFVTDVIGVEVRDLDQRLIRNWERLLCVRLDETWLQQMNEQGIFVPDPLVGEKDAVQYVYADEEYEHRFDTNENGRVRIPVAKPGQDGPGNVGYQYVFRDWKGRLRHEDVDRFFMQRDAEPTLPGTIFAPWHTYRSPREWLAVIGLYLLAMLFVTFGLYRPFYVWRLHRSDAALKSRDWAVSLWLFFAFALWGVIVWMWAPRPYYIWTTLGVLGLVWLLYLLINAARPREEGI
ncbi:MAG: hypothetical protein ABIK65_14765 [Candidatus Eisenbacteria bacterium]